MKIYFILLYSVDKRALLNFIFDRNLLLPSTRNGTIYTPETLEVGEMEKSEEEGCQEEKELCKDVEKM